jgi:TonB family protein
VSMPFATAILSLALSAPAVCQVRVDYPAIEPGLALNQGVHPPPPPAPPPKSSAAVTWIVLNGRTIEAKLVRRVMPEYPRSACRAKVTGTVRLEVRLAPDGSVRETKVIEGSPRFAPAAEAAIRRWRYRPTLLNGKPIEVETTILIRFETGPKKARPRAVRRVVRVVI